MFDGFGSEITGGGEGEATNALAGLQSAISNAAATGGRGRRGRGRKLIKGGEANLSTDSIASLTGSVAPPIGGRRRRKTLKRPRKKSRSRRHMSRKHRFLGGSTQEHEDENEEEQEQEQEQEQEEEEEEEELTGGRSRRKGRRGKKTRGKVSGWIKHVLRFAKENKMKYFQALKDKRCRSTYKANKK